MSYTKEVLEAVVKISFSYQECLIRLNRKLTYSSLECIKIKITSLKIDVSHFHTPEIDLRKVRLHSLIGLKKKIPPKMI